MLVRDVMSSPVISVAAETTIRDAAERMRRHGVGTLPVLQDRAPAGIVTDRDLVTRALGARGGALGPETRVAAIMTRTVLTCLPDGEVADAAALMGEEQLRRLLVVDRAGAALGLLSLGDIAEHVSEELAGQALGEISEARARDARA